MRSRARINSKLLAPVSDHFKPPKNTNVSLNDKILARLQIHEMFLKLLRKTQKKKMKEAKETDR